MLFLLIKNIPQDKGCYLLISLMVITLLFSKDTFFRHSAKLSRQIVIHNTKKLQDHFSVRSGELHTTSTYMNRI